MVKAEKLFIVSILSCPYCHQPFNTLWALMGLICPAFSTKTERGGVRTLSFLSRVGPQNPCRYRKSPSVTMSSIKKGAASYSHYQLPGNYHRPWEISLLCSEWEQVEHSRYGHPHITSNRIYYVPTLRGEAPQRSDCSSDLLPSPHLIAFK